MSTQENPTLQIRLTRYSLKDTPIGPNEFGQIFIDDQLFLNSDPSFQAPPLESPGIYVNQNKAKELLGLDPTQWVTHEGYLLMQLIALQYLLGYKIGLVANAGNQTVTIDTIHKMMEKNEGNLQKYLSYIHEVASRPVQKAGAPTLVHVTRATTIIDKMHGIPLPKPIPVKKTKKSFKRRFK